MTAYNTCLKRDPLKLQQKTQDILKYIKIYKKKLDSEFNKSVEKHWQNIYSKISHKETEKFMPTINNIFRPKKKKIIKELKVNINNRNLINDANCDITKLSIDNGEYSIGEE